MESSSCPEKKLKLIVSSLHTCSKAAKKQRIELQGEETLAELGNMICSTFTADDFVPAGGKFYFQYYDSEEEDMVGIPRYDEGQYLAKDFRGKKLCVVPIDKPNNSSTSNTRNSENNSNNSTNSNSLEETPRAKKRKTKPNQKRKSKNRGESSDSDDNSVVFVGVKPHRGMFQKRKRRY